MSGHHCVKLGISYIFGQNLNWSASRNEALRLSVYLEVLSYLEGCVSFSLSSFGQRILRKTKHTQTKTQVSSSENNGSCHIVGKNSGVFSSQVLWGHNSRKHWVNSTKLGTLVDLDILWSRHASEVNRLKAKVTGSLSRHPTWTSTSLECSLLGNNMSRFII